MRKIQLILTCFLLPSSLVAELPDRASTLLTRLAEWEAEKKIQYESEIQAKRAEIVEILEQEMESVARAGDVDGALAIKKEISNLKGTDADAEVSGMPQEPLRRLRKLLDRESVWQRTDLAGWRLVIDPRGDSYLMIDGSKAEDWTVQVNEEGEAVNFKNNFGPKPPFKREGDLLKGVLNGQTVVFERIE